MPHTCNSQCYSLKKKFISEETARRRAAIIGIIYMKVVSRRGKKPKQLNGNFFIFRSCEDDSRNDKCNLIRNSNWIDGYEVVLPLISQALSGFCEKKTNFFRFHSDDSGFFGKRRDEAKSYTTRAHSRTLVSNKLSFWLKTFYLSGNFNCKSKFSCLSTRKNKYRLDSGSERTSAHCSGVALCFLGNISRLFYKFDWILGGKLPA